MPIIKRQRGWLSGSTSSTLPVPCPIKKLYVTKILHMDTTLVRVSNTHSQ